MKVKYDIKAKKMWSLLHRAVVRSAVEFALDAYDLNGWGRLTVKLNFIPEEYGSAISFDEDDHIIFISAHTDLSIVLKTVFHELWHIQQYVHQGFDLENNAAFWRGEYFAYGHEMSFKEYQDLPWEREAREMEAIMYDRFTRINKNLDS